jgi:hypothetical protein
VCNDDQRERLLSRIRSHVTELKKYQYGKHILTRVEKLLSAGTRIQTGQRSGPVNVGVVVQVGGPGSAGGPQAAAAASAAVMGGMLDPSMMIAAGTLQPMVGSGREAALNFEECIGKSGTEEGWQSHEQVEPNGIAGVDLPRSPPASVGPAVQSESCNEALAALKLLL